MLHKVASKGKPVIIASGASTINEITDAVNILLQYNIDICLMQCNTNYTADIENFKYINLNVLKTFKTLYPNIKLGLSDHTLGNVTVLGAVALGATMVENHFTDDTSRKGPDHPFSMDPQSWRTMVNRTRLLEASLGSTIKNVENNELETVVLQRRSIRVNKNMHAGEVITEKDLIEVRPCPVDAIPPNINVIGKTLNVGLNKNDYLKYEHIRG